MATSELSVITKAKDLCSYIMTVTDKSPKRFRFTLVSRMQNYGLDIIENLISANEIYVKVTTGTDVKECPTLKKGGFMTMPPVGLEKVRTLPWTG